MEIKSFFDLLQKFLMYPVPGTWLQGIKSPEFTEVRFASFFSGGFTTMAVINPQERKLAKTHLCGVVCFDLKLFDNFNNLQCGKHLFCSFLYPQYQRHFPY